jgi:hypothetical protein
MSNLTTLIRGRLPLMLIVLIGLGNVLVGLTGIVPALRAHEQLVGEVAAGRQALTDRAAKKGQQTEADTLQLQINSAKAKLDKAASGFWTELQLNGIVDRMYEYADSSGVKIANLQSQQPQSGQGAQNKKTNAFDVRIFRLQVEGTAPQLLNFVARIRELSLPTVTIANLNITRSDTQSTLTVNLQVLTSPFASGEVFSTLPKISTPTRIPSSATPTLTPTSTSTPTITPSPSATPTATATLKPTATAIPGTPTLVPAPPCNDQATETMRRLSFSQVQASSTVCQTQIWNIALDRAYDIVIDIERRSGDGQYRIELHDRDDNIVTTALSSSDGRGILVAKSGSGTYTIRVVPLAASETWGYSIALWKGMPSLSFSFTQSSYSSHTSLGDRANITRWRYVLTSSQSYHVEVVRTDGNLEYTVAVLDAMGQPLTSIQSSDGNVDLALTSNAGTYFVEIMAVGGTSGSYRISLVP